MKARTFQTLLPPGMLLWLKHALPNAVTIMAMFFGLTGLLYAGQHAFSSAIACVLISAVLDACDGRVARATGTSSKFGAELDSLSDVVCFGAVPAFIMYNWGLENFGNLGWFACLTLAGAAALRLARFNVASSAHDRPSWMGHFFNGIPAPGGAFLALTPIYMMNAQILNAESSSRFAFYFLPIVAGLMVSNWPTFSAKAISRKALRLLFIPTLLVAFATLIGLVVAPWLTLSLCSLAYLLSLPFSKLRYGVYARRKA